MPLEDEERAPMPRARIREDPVGRLGVEMTERRAPRPRQHCPLDDAVVDQRIMDDEVVAAEQMTYYRDVCRMAADQGDAVFGAVNPCQRALEVAVYRALAGNRPTGRDGRAIAIDRRLRRGSDPRIAVETDIIVGGEIDVGAVADHRFGAGDPVVNAEERVVDAKIIGRLLDQTQFAVRLELGDIEPPRFARSGLPPPLRRRRCDPRGGSRRQLFDQASLGLRRQSKEVAACRHPFTPLPPTWSRPDRTRWPPLLRQQDALRPRPRTARLG